LSEGHGEELLPAEKLLGVPVAIVVSHAAAELAIRKKTYQLGEDASRQSNSTSRILLSRGWPVNGSMWQPGASTFSLPMAGMLILPRHLAFVPCGATASAKRPNESRRRPTRRLPRLPNFQSSFWASSRGDASAVLFSDCRRYKLPNTPDSSPGKRFSNSSDCRKLWIEVPSVRDPRMPASRRTRKWCESEDFGISMPNPPHGTSPCLATCRTISRRMGSPSAYNTRARSESEGRFFFVRKAMC